MAMEEGEKECREKAEKLLALFQDKFFAMYYTVHPSGLYGEARGKSSNVAWATTQYAKNHMVPEENRFEIFTIVDADTHLTQKYFECITFKYCRANSEEQTRILFAPVLVFDRNANKVPFVVRLADICWSIGLIGNFQMPVKFPCSVYSVSMLLAQHVNFWDAGPEAIGEDMHMSIKCLTRTRMKLKLTPIYIPASCSNVQGNSYMKSIKARFQQSKRHLWGSLDFGYLVSSLITRRCWTANPLKCFLAIYFLFEIFFQPFFGVYHLSGQYIFPASTVIPLGDIVVVYGTYIRYGLMLPAVVVGLAYEWYHYQACRYRSEILKKVSNRKRIDANSESVLNGVTVATDNENGMTINAVASGYGESDVGFRAWYQILDWLGLPFCLIFYYVFPGVCAMLGQLFTNRMDYKVSLKPTTRYAIDENITDANGQAVQAVNERPRNSSVVSQSDNNIAMDNIDSHGMVNIVVEAKHAAMRGHVPRDSGVEMDINEDDLEATRVRYHTVTSNWCPWPLLYRSAHSTHALERKRNRMQSNQ